MYLSEIKNHINELSNSWEEFKRINDRKLDEIAQRRQSDPLTSEHLERLTHVMDECKDSLVRLEASQSRPNLDKQISPSDQEHKKLLSEYLRGGSDGALRDWQKKQSIGPIGESAGFLLTHRVSEAVLSKISDLSVMRDLASVESISTDYISLIKDDQDFVVEWGDNLTEANNHLLAASVINIFTYDMHAQIRLTQRFLDDAMLDVESWLADKMARAFARAENKMFITGASSEENPTGILSYPDGSGDLMIKRINSGDAAKITTDALITMYYSLKEEYAENATFLMNRETVQYLRSLKSTQTGQYIWQPGLAQGAPDTLMGVPVAQSSSMPTMAAGSIAVALADFKRAYKIIDRHQITLMRDPFSNKPYVTFYATKRVGGQVVDFDAIKLMVVKAS